MEHLEKVIKNIYGDTSSSMSVRERLASFLVPTDSERSKNAEISTPPYLVDEMLGTLPLDYWKSPKKVIDPCCGKGAFMLGLYDKFFIGLDYITDVEERCKLICEECLYYNDLNPSNVKITELLIKHHTNYLCGKTPKIVNVEKPKIKLTLKVKQ